MQLVNEPDQFTAVTKKSTRSVKTNSTFKVIEELIKEKSDLISQCGFELVTLHKETGKAFLFKDASLPNTLHYAQDGFVFLERHLRVDQFYSLATTTKGQQGFTAAHYTENYRHPHTKENMTIHLYYDDSCQYVQVKRYQDKENSQLLDESSIEKTVQQNAYRLIALYKKFNMEKNSRYLSALNAADEAETAMKKQWHALASIDQIQQYITTIDAFCGHINKVNFYNELETDCRDVFMRKIQESLRARLKMFQEPASPMAACPEVEEPQIENAVAAVQQTTTLHRKAQPSKPATTVIDEEFATLNNLSFALRNLLKNLTPKNYVEASRIADELNLKLLLYVPTETINKSKRKAKRKQTKEMEDLVNSLPDIYEYYLEYVMSGDLESITDLLPILKHATLSKLFYQLLFKLLDEKLKDESKLATKLRAICEFLHKNSATYKSLIKFSSCLLFFNKEDKVGCSILTNAAANGKFLTFCMFLDHGYDPDSLGITYNNLTLSQLKSTISVTRAEQFVIKLLEKGATIDAPRLIMSLYHQQIQPINRHILTNVFNMATKSPSSTEKNFYTKMASLSLFPDLALAMNDYQFALIPHLLPQTSFLNAVFALANCVHLQGITRRLIPQAKVSGLYLCPSREAANRLTDEVRDAFGESFEVAILVYLENRTLEKDLHYMQMLVDFVKAHCEKHPDDIQQLIKQAEVMAKQLPEDQDICYLVGYILFAELIRDDENNTSYRQQMMRQCCLLGAFLKQKMLDYAQCAYKEAMTLAINNDQLKSTPMYEYAKKKFEETSAQSTNQPNTYQGAIRFTVNLADPESSNKLRSLLGNNY